MSLISFYLGTYTEPIKFGTGKILEGKGEGIYRGTLNPANGEIHIEGLAVETVNPSYIAFSHNNSNLYAVNELKEFNYRASGAVSSFSYDDSNGKLNLLNQLPTQGTDPCHIVTDPTDSVVFVANFMSGSVAVYKTKKDGSLDGPTDFVQHSGASVDTFRQAGPHAHAVIFDSLDGLLYVPDLGLDKLLVYKVDIETGTVKERASLCTKTTPGSGPRHLEFHPSRRFAYLVNELDSTVAILGFDAQSGKLSFQECVPLLPPDFSGESTAADIHLSPSGEFLYCSNRGHDSIAAFRVDQVSGSLALVGHTSSGGQSPRNFAIDPSGTFLITANQDSDTLVTFRIDPVSGTLSPTGYTADAPTPVCIKFLKNELFL